MHHTVGEPLRRGRPRSRSPVGFGRASSRLALVAAVMCCAFACDASEKCTAILESEYGLTPAALESFPDGKLFREGSRLILEWEVGGARRRAVWRIDAEGSVEYR